MNAGPIGSMGQAAAGRSAAPPHDVFAVVLAGGRGTRLGALTEQRAKPALPIAGTLRVIDFAIDNCLNAGIRDLAVLLQYRAGSLQPHLARYRSDPRAAGLVTACASQQVGGGGYLGTADAVYRNLGRLRASGARHVLVLAGDQVYRMNPGAMLAEHVQRGAAATVACLEVPRADARRFGVVATDVAGRVTGFVEKPADPPTRPGRPGVSLASMGLYLFDMALLADVLGRDARDPASGHDFGYDVLPLLVREGLLHAHDFADSAVRGADGSTYWRDVGTIESYWAAQMDFVDGVAGFEPHDPCWPITGTAVRGARSRSDPHALAPDDRSGRSLVAAGCEIAASSLWRSVVGEGVSIGRGCDLQESVLLPGAILGPRVALRRVIVDEGCVVPAGLRVGFDRALDSARFHVDGAGITVVTRAMLERMDTGAVPGTSPVPAGLRHVDRGLAAA